MSFTKMYTTTILILLFIFISLPVLFAQDNSSGLSPTGTDPAEPRSRFNAFLTRIEPLGTGYILQTTASGDWALKEWASIGLRVPLVYADFPSSQTFEVGDIQINTLLAFYRPKIEGSLDAIAFGLDAFLNTGDVETGTGFGQYIIAPYLAASLYPADEIMITPIVEEYISLNKDDDTGRDRNDLSIRINTTFTIDQVWLTLVPELLIDMLGQYENLWTLHSSLGYMFNERSGISADVVTQLAGEKRFRYLGRLNYRYLLP
ncbi:MAG: hypothetical protein GQ561_04965 [Calditrichae bacterium]|nr:hypothetical protein [Calditrichia bacterium]